MKKYIVDFFSMESVNPIYNQYDAWATGNTKGYRVNGTIMVYGYDSLDEALARFDGINLKDEFDDECAACGRTKLGFGMYIELLEWQEKYTGYESIDSKIYTGADYVRDHYEMTDDGLALKD